MAVRIKGNVPGHLIVEDIRPRNQAECDDAGKRLFEFLWGHINFSDVLPAFLDEVARCRRDLLQATLRRYKEQNR